MNYKKLIAVTIAFTVCALAGSNVTAHGGGGGHGGFSGGAFGRAGFNGGGFRAGFRGGGFRDGGFRGDRFHHRDFDNRFVFFGDFGDPFFYYPDPYYGYYPYSYYPYGYGYGSYHQPVYQGSGGYTDSLIGRVQLRLARAGYYHGAIDGVSGSGTRRSIREYERAHSLPEDGKIGQTTANDNGLELRIAGRFGFGTRAVNAAKLPIEQSHIPQKVVFYRAPDEEKSIHQSFFFKDWGIKVGLRRLY